MKDTYTLRKPVDFEGGAVTKLEYDLDALKAGDILNVQSQLRDAGQDIGMTFMFDQASNAGAVVFASGLPVSFLFELGAVDYVALLTIGQGFFGAGLADTPGTATGSKS